MKVAAALSCVIAVVFLASFAASQTQPASLKFFFSHDAVVKLQDGINPFLLQSMKNVKLPDQEISELGIHIYLTQIVMVDFTFSDQTVTFLPPNSININIPNIVAHVNMNWEYKDGPLIDWSGTANDTISGTTASVTLTVGTDTKGHATLQVSGVSLSIGSLDISLHGDGSSVFQFIVNLITPLLKKVAASTIEGVMQSNLNTLLSTLFNAIPIQINVLPEVAINYGLIPTTAQYGMVGTYYSNNHFSGSGSPTSYTSFDQISLGAYDSIDITGYFHPPTSGNYAFQIYLDQRGEIDINGFSAGSLEKWNIGMCWPESATHTTSLMYLDASKSYALRLQYQSGCGGGWVQPKFCPNGTNCQALPALGMTTAPATEVPIAVYETYVELSSATTALYVPTGAVSPSAHHPAPNTPPSSLPLGVTFDDYILNSLGFAAYTAGDLAVNVTSLPSASPFQLNTTSFQFIIPDLYKHYPNDAMVLEIAANSAPEFTISAANNITIFADLTANISVIVNDTLVNAIELDVTIDVGADAYFNNTAGTLAFNIDSFSVGLKQVWGSVDFNCTLLEPFFNAIIGGTVVPMLNQKLNAGIPLPAMDGLGLFNSSLIYGDHILTLTSDFNFTLPARVKALALMALEEEADEVEPLEPTHSIRIV